LDDRPRSIGLPPLAASSRQEVSTLENVLSLYLLSSVARVIFSSNLQPTEVRLFKESDGCTCLRQPSLELGFESWPCPLPTLAKFFLRNSEFICVLAKAAPSRSPLASESLQTSNACLKMRKCSESVTPAMFESRCRQRLFLA
jgi:hypothetical protein